jgi:hypothetical protein
VPFANSSFANEALDRLSKLGESLWKELQSHRIVSVNGGKRTVAFRPLACNQTRDAIDALLVEAAGLPAQFGDELKDLVQRLVLVDPRDKRRKHLHNYFTDSNS